jgi:hypothetical protein
MKRRFVLDENIIVFAESLTDSKNQFNTMSLMVIALIIGNCDAIVADETLMTKYYEKFRSLQNDAKGVRGPAVTRMLTQLMNNSAKYIFSDSPAAIDGEEEIPREDVFLVRLAAATQSTLVTRDDELLTKVKESKINKRYSFEIGTPEEIFTLYYVNP